MNERFPDRYMPALAEKHRLPLFKVYWTSEQSPPPNGESWVTFVRAPRLMAAREYWWKSPDAKRVQDARIVKVDRFVEADPYDGII